MAKKAKSYTHRIKIDADSNKNTVKVNLSPGLKHASLTDRQTLVNVLLSGTSLGLQSLLSELPILRAATEKEVNAKIYVYENPEEDNKLYKQRKAMYDTFTGIFEETLSNLFPDVEYIERCTKYQQETIFDMSTEEADKHNEDIAFIVAEVREELNKEEDSE